MAKPQYGYEHQLARKQALAEFKDGTPCPLCHRPMHTWQSLDLNHVRPVAFGGTNGPKVLTHRYCNRAEGSRIRYGKRNRNRYRRIRNGSRIDGDPLKEGSNPVRSARRKLPRW